MDIAHDTARPAGPARRFKIAQMIDRLERPGGAEALMVTLAEAMASLPVDLTFITIKPSDQAMIREIEATGARVRPFIARKLVAPRRLGALCRFIRQEGFDLIQTHLTGATILGTAAGLICRVPVVTTVHSTVFQSDRHPYHGRLERHLLRRRIREVIAVGRETAKVSRERLGGRDLTVIPNAVAAAPVLDQAERQRLRSEMGVPDGRDDALLLVWAGRLAEAKGLPDLLEAFASLAEGDQRAFLAIVGDGSMEGELKRLSEEMGLNERVRFTGRRSDVMRLFAAGDIHVSASHWEGFPIAMLEAMSAGLPVVATAVGDVPTILADGAGLMVAPSDPRALAAELAKVLADDTLRRRLGQAAQARVATRYRAAAWAEAHLDLYRRLLGVTTP
jgi:glycosyltransferase involved in cell wall biosynthesis